MRRKYYGSNLFVMLCLHKVNGIDDNNNNNRNELKRFRRLRQNDQKINNVIQKLSTKVEAVANHHHRITTTLIEIDNMNVQQKSNNDNKMENKRILEEDNIQRKYNAQQQQQQQQRGQQRHSSTTLDNNFMDIKTRSTTINNYNNLDGILSSGSSSISDRLHKLLYIESDNDRVELDRFLQEGHEMSMSMSLLYF